MPLTEFQAALGRLLAANRSEDCYLAILEEKGHLRHEQVGRRYLYSAVVAREKARGSVLRGLLENFFGGSRSKLVAALLNDPDAKPSDEELEVIARMIKSARKEGK